MERFAGVTGIGLILTLLCVAPVSASSQANTALPSGPPVRQPDPSTNTFADAPAFVPSALAVGRTPGSFAVSSTGAAIYRIPLWTPIGIAGLKPDLSLVYSSEGGDDVYGVGWAVAGFSSVTRCKRTMGEDGIEAAVLLTSADLACLDGNKLRTFGGTTYWADSSQYQTAIADFSLIIYHSTGSGWFEVHRKDGLIYQYGNTTDSALLATSTTTALQWALNRISDRVGNHIDFVYTNDTTNQVLRPLTITYVTSPGTTAAPNFQVQFSYVSRSGKIPGGFVAGMQFLEPYLAQTITIAALSGSSYSAVKTYNFTYGTSSVTGRSLLQTVQECSPTQCFPATTVGYQNGQAGWGAALTSSGNISLGSAFVLDLNGDGIDDLFYVDQTSGAWRYLLGTTSGVYAGPYDPGISSSTGIVLPIDFNSDGKTDLLVNNASGNWRIMYFQGAGQAFTYTDTNVPVPSGVTTSLPFLIGDVDGDGRDDLIYVASGGSAWNSNDTIYYYRNTGSTLAAAQVLFQTSNVAPCDNGCMKFTSTPFGNVPTRGYNSRVRRADFNGDGRLDFFVNIVTCTAPDVYPSGCGKPAFQTKTWNLFLSSGTGVSYTNINYLTQGSSTWLIAPPLIGDFNGDGCSDIAYLVSGNQWVIQYGTCYRAGATTVLSAGVLAGTGYGIYPIAIDWDGDGRDDIVEPNAATGGTWGVLQSTGTTLNPWTSTGIPYNTNNFAAVVDGNGDGLYDILYQGGAGANVPTLLPHKGVGLIPDRANSFTDGVGVNYSPVYAQLSRNQYTPGSGATYPEQDLQIPLNVTASYTASDGIGGTYTVTESYAAARMDISRHFFEGFSSIETVDSRDGILNFVYYNQAYPMTGAPSRHVTYQPPPNSAYILDDLNTTVSVATLDSTANNQRYFPYMSGRSDARYELGGSLDHTNITLTTTTVTYGGPHGFTYGNPGEVSTTVQDKDPTSPWNGNIFTHSYQITPHEDGSTGSTGWCIGLADEVDETREQPNNASITRHTSYGIDATGLCRVTSRTQESGNATLQVSTTIAYDSCGNPDSVSVTGKNPDGTSMSSRTTGFNYGSHCIAPETITNALNQSRTLGYRYDLMLLTSATDLNNLLTQWSYNDVGQKTLEQRPDGTQTAWSRTSSSGRSDHAVYNLTRTENDATTGHAAYWNESTYLDAFDRVVNDGALQSNGSTANVAITYDARGNLATHTNPYGNGFASYTTTDIYDILNRKTAEQRPINAGNSTLQYTYYGYEGRTMTITDPKSYITTQKSDVIGELMQVIDPDGSSTTNFGYDPFGNRTLIKDPAGNQTTRTYDTLGYLLATFADPDRGTWTVQLDSLGELINLRDAKTTAPNWTQVLSYDALGRPLTRLESEGTTTWQWGTSAAAHEIGRLKQLSGLSDMENYSFDQYGRLADHSMTWGLVTYAIDYTYNTLGNVDVLTYPSTPLSSNRFQVKYNYTNGYLSSLQNDTGGTLGTTFWQLTAGTANMDPWGHIADETLGTASAVRIQSAFDAVTGWVGARQVGSGGSGNNLQSLAYQYDLNGNLSQRQDLKQSLTEAFTMDNLNRLQSSTLNGTSNLTLVIDSTGNVTSRTEAGVTSSFGYDPVHTHALTTVNGVSQYSYDANGNMISAQSMPWATVQYSSANLPTAFIASNHSTVSSFAYGPDRQRKQQTALYSGDGTTGTESTVYVAGLFEVETTPSQTHYKHFIPVPSGTQIIYDLQSVGGAQTTYITADSLGSGNLILNSAGSVAANLSFAAYGARRASNWSGSLPANSSDYGVIASTTRRGYTDGFHEMLDNLALIHMNGRVYHPGIGRFLSPDPLREPRAIANSQGWNPYAYVDNRVLTLTDPTGLVDPPDPTRPIADAGGAAAGWLDEIDLWGTRDPTPSRVLVLSPEAVLDRPIANTGDPSETVTVTGHRTKGSQQIPCLFGVNCYVQPQGNPPCGSGAVAPWFPHGIGLYAGAEAGAGVYAAGADAQVGAGAGYFSSSSNGGSTGAFTTYAATANAANSVAGTPTQQSTPAITGLSGGGGGYLFVTNAQSAQQLTGPFTTRSINVGVGPLQASVFLSTGGGIWQFGISPPFAGETLGVALTKVTTNTILSNKTPMVCH